MIGNGKHAVNSPKPLVHPRLEHVALDGACLLGTEILHFRDERYCLNKSGKAFSCEAGYMGDRYISAEGFKLDTLREQCLLDLAL